MKKGNQSKASIELVQEQSSTSPLNLLSEAAKQRTEPVTSFVCRFVMRRLTLPNPLQFFTNLEKTNAEDFFKSDKTVIS